MIWYMGMITDYIMKAATPAMNRVAGRKETKHKQQGHRRKHFVKILE